MIRLHAMFLVTLNLVCGIAQAMDTISSPQELVRQRLLAFEHVETERTVIRKIMPHDLSVITAIINDPVIKEFDAELSTISDVQELMQQIFMAYQKGSPTKYMIAHKTTGESIGICGYAGYGPQSSRVSIDISLLQSWRGMGMGQEVIKKLISFAFNDLKLNRITATADPDNHASLHMIEKLSFCHEGRLREYVRCGGQFRDRNIFSLLRKEWLSQNKQAE